MSYDRYEREYHLTPSGWKLGTFFFYGKADKVIPAPPDRVLTLVKEVEQASGYSPEDVRWRTDWTSDDKKNVAVLLKKFGDQPTHTE